MSSSILAMESISEPVASLLQRARAVRGQPRSLLARTHVGSALLALAADASDADASRPLPAATRSALVRLREGLSGRRLLLLRLPQKDEVQAGRLRGDHAAELAALGIESRSLLGRCGLETSDFGRDDPHPSSSGYAKIARCVARELELE
jgi:hypothetical protein